MAWVLPGSEIVDLIATLAVGGIGTGVLVTVFHIGERVLKDRSHRIGTNEVNLASAQEELQHKTVMHRIEEISRLADVRERLVAIDERDDDALRVTLAVRESNPRSELDRAQHAATEIGIRDELDASIVERSLGSSNTINRQQHLDQVLVKAYSDAITAVRRMSRAQRRGEAVEDIYLIDDELS